MTDNSTKFHLARFNITVKHYRMNTKSVSFSEEPKIGSVLITDTCVQDVSKSLPDFSNPRMLTRVRSMEIYSHCTNSLKNSRALNNLFNKQDCEEVYLYGFTKFDVFNYNFPVFCSRNEFVTFLYHLKHHRDRRALIVDGLLTKALLLEFPYVWRNFLGRPLEVGAHITHPGRYRRSFQGAFVTYGELYFYVTVFCAMMLLTACLCDGRVVPYDTTLAKVVWTLALLFPSGIFGMLGFVRQNSYHQFFRLLSVILEEFIKRELLGHWSFAIFEYLHKATSASDTYSLISSLFPLVMHIGVGQFDFTLGVLFHFLWNTYINVFFNSLPFHPCDYLQDRVVVIDALSFCMDKCSPVMLKLGGLPPWTYRNVSLAGTFTVEGINFDMVEEVSFALDFLRKMYKRDVAGLALSVGMRAGYLKTVLEIFSMNDFDELARELHESVLAPTQLTGLGGIIPLLNLVVPEFVSKSPTTRRILAFAFVIGSTPFCANFGIMKKLSELVDWDSLPDGGSFMETSISALKAVYDAFTRVSESGNWKDIFGLGEDVKFVREARELLIQSVNPGSDISEITAYLDKVEALIERRKFKWNEGQIGVMLAKLTETLTTIKLRCLDEPFNRRSREILEEVCPRLTVAGMHGRMNEIRALLNTRRYTKNDGPTCKLIDQLHVKLKDYIIMLMDCSVRKHPFCINFMGITGFGKSSILAAIANALTFKDGNERFVGDTLIYLLNAKYPCESGIHKDATILIADDIPFDYTSCKQNGTEPADIFFQRFINKTPFEIMAAFDKGIILSNIKYGFFTSNFTEYIGDGPAKKLQRRFNMGLNVYCSFEGGRTFEDVQHLTPEERNQYMRFTLYECKVNNDKDTRWRFERIDASGEYNLPDFIRLVIAKSIEHDLKEEAEWNLFNSVENSCPCGVPKVFHCDTPGHYVALTPHCKDFNEILPLAEVPVLDMEPLDVAFNVDTEFDYFRMTHNVEQTLLNQALEDDETLEAIPIDPSTILTGLGDIEINFWTLVAGYFIYKYARTIFDKLWSDIWDEITKKEVELVESRFFPKLFEFSWHRSVYAEFLDSDVACRLYVFVTKVKCYYQIHKQKILGLTTAMAAGVLYKWCQKNDELTGAPIYREQVNPASLVLLEPTREQQWTAEQRRSWGVESKEITILKPHKVGVAFDDLVRIVKQAVRSAKFICDDNVKDPMTGNVVFWSPQWISCNRHFIKQGATRVKIEINGVMQAYLTREFIPFGDSELLLFQNLFDPSCYPLHDFLAEDYGRGPWVVHVPYKPFQGMGTMSSFYSIYDKRSFTSVAMEFKNEKGDCGNLVIAHAYHGWVVLGAISALNTHTHATLVCRKDFEAVRKDPFPFIHSFSPESCVLTSIGPLVERSETRHFDSPLMIPIGSLGKNDSQFHSKIVRTRLYDDVYPLLSEGYDIPKKVKGENGFGEWKHAMLQFFRVVTYRCDLPMCEAMFALRAYLDDAVPPQVVIDNGWKLRPCSAIEAIFGVGQVGIDRIKFDTSCGPFWKDLGVKDKYDLFVETSPGCYDFREDYSQRLIEFQKTISTGALPYLDAQFSYKDEVRKISKLLEFLIRMFAVPNFHFNHLMRMYLMPLVSFLLDHPVWSECYGGINAGSKQWHQLACHLRKHDFFVDMDFTGFDTTHRLLIVILVARFFYLFALRMSYTVEEATMCFYLVSMIMVQRVIFGKDVLLKMFGLPSGIIITLIMNSVVNSILMRIAFQTLIKDIPLKDFQKFVSAATTGDDNASGISKLIIERFNMLTIEKVYECIGYTVTSAAKDGVLRAHIPFETLTFLKRAFRYDDELAMYVAPIAKDSIYKSLCFQSQKLGVTGDVRLGECAASAQREAFLHGKDFFFEMQEQLTFWFNKHQMSLMLELLPREQIIKEYHEGTFKTFMV